MSRIFCFLCETGTVPKNLRGHVWCHLDCLMELFNLKNDMESIKKIIEGKKHESIEEFLKRMQSFDKKWKNTTKLLFNKEGEGEK